MKIIIQQRDIQILKFVFACRVVSYDQIIRRHFPKTDEAIARRRIRKLAESGYLQISIRYVNGKAVRTVQPLPAIWSVISEKWPFGINVPHFKSKSPEHDVRAAEVFMKFEKLKCFRSYFTENLLQSSSDLAEDPRFRDLAKIQADGALSLEDAKGNLRVYGVEYELSKKSPDGYKEKITDYFLAKGIDGVFYISPMQEVQTLLTRVESEIGHNRVPLVWFKPEDTAQDDSNKIIFKNREGKIIELA